jgi:putative peptidoglycan lipid II flippase
VRNDEQQPPQAQQPYTGRQHSQEPQSPRPPVGPMPAYPPPGPNNPSNPPSGHLVDPAYNPISQFPAEPYYPDLTMDMGSSLGYGQSMEYHTLSMPQPTQSMPRLRQSRLQQLREERMRRQQRRINLDATILRQRKEGLGIPEKKITFPPGTPSGPLGQAPALPGTPPASPLAPPSSPLPGAPALPGGVPSTPAGRVSSPALVASTLQPAAEAAQDTGMIQRVKVARAAFLITGAFMFSSILGLVRTFLFTYVFGATNFSDSYLQAFLIPNLIFTVVSGGALSSAFIPVFTTYAVGRKDEKTAWHIASSALNLSVIIMITLSALAMLLAPVIVPLYSPGFPPAQLALITTLTRIMLLQAIVLGSGVIVSAVLNAKQDFSYTALGTVLYNVGLILGLIPGFFLSFHSRSTTPADLAVYSATWGVVLGAILQVGVQIPGLFKVRMHYTFSFDWRHPGVIQIGRQMIPRIINAAMLSFSTSVDRFLLAFLTAVATATVVNGLITEYFQAFSILLLPVSIFGSSVSTAAFPTLASYVARTRFDRVRSIIMETLRGILFLSIPSCIGLIVLALPVIQVLLEHGRYTLQEAQFTAIPLIFFAVGLPGLAAVEILTRAFYALQDSRTPVVISVAQFILKIALSVILINLAVFGVQWGMGALALSTSVASTLEALVLFVLLYQRIGGFDLRSLLSFIGRSFLAAAVMGGVLFVVRTGLDRVIDTTTTNTLIISGILKALLKLLIELGIGSLVFLVLARLLKIEEMNSGPVRRILNRLHISWL